MTHKKKIGLKVVPTNTMHKLKQIKVKPGLGRLLRPDNVLSLFHSPRGAIKR